MIAPTSVPNPPAHHNADVSPPHGGVHLLGGADPVGDVTALRDRIDDVDSELIRLWSERAELSRRIGAARVAAGGTRLVLSREQRIVERFRRELGPDGTQLAMLLLRAGRGPL